MIKLLVGVGTALVASKWLCDLWQKSEVKLAEDSTSWHDILTDDEQRLVDALDFSECFKSKN